MTIFICGNPLLPEDNLPIRLMPELTKQFPDLDFAYLDPTENLKPENGEIYIIDTVKDIDRVMLIDNIDQIQLDRIVSLHDFDLAFNLKLLFKIGKLNKVVIFGVPDKIEDSLALEQLKQLISNSTQSLLTVIPANAGIQKKYRRKNNSNI